MTGCGLMSQTTTKRLSNIDVELTAKFFRGLGDASRLKILEHLLENESDIEELAELLKVPIQQVNRHLSCLAWCGYIIAREIDKRVYYMIADKRIEQLIKMAEGLMTNRAYFINTCKVIK